MKKHSKDLEQIDITEADECDNRKPDLILNLESNKDFIAGYDKDNKQRFVITLGILIIVAIILLRANSEDMLEICKLLMSVILFIAGFWLGKAKNRELIKVPHAKTD